MKPKPEPVPPLLRYTGLGIQLMATIAVLGWLGYQLDDYLQWKSPVFLLTFIFIGMGAQFYKLYRELNKNP